MFLLVGLLVSRVDGALASLGSHRRFFCGFGSKYGFFLLFVATGQSEKKRDLRAAFSSAYTFLISLLSNT